MVERKKKKERRGDKEREIYRVKIGKDLDLKRTVKGVGIEGCFNER